ncbi:MAG: hypothetical protein KAH57_11120 [Thermoplasmata archaeon]|nr:hypothetical protein [Thermoplasmata archaeon]
MAKKKAKRSNIQVPAGAVYALLAAISLICFTVLAVVIADYDGGDEEGTVLMDVPQTKTAHLFIEDVFFKGLEGAPMRVEMTIYLTNDGTEAARDVKVDAWPIMAESNIAKSGTTISVSDIEVNRTASPDLVLYLEPDTVHNVEIIIFEDGMIVLRGRSTVSTSGSGVSEYRSVEVRGTSDDRDYDGIADDWEEYYGLDPNDPNDANEDPDHDGLTNLEEYRLMTDPVDMYIEDPEMDSGAPSMAWGIGKEDEDSTAIVGVSLFLLLIVGVLAILIGSAVYSYRKREQKSGLNSSEPIKDTSGSSGQSAPFLDYEARKGGEE